MDQRLNMRLLLTAQEDWNIQACGLLAQGLQDLGCEVFVAHDPFSSAISLPFTPVWKGTVLPLSPERLAISDLTRHVDAIGVFAAPDVVARFRETHQLACSLAGHRAVPVFSGPCHPLTGDLLEDDLLGRLGCDLLCLHGPAETEVLRELTLHSPDSAQGSVEMGLWQLPTAPGKESDEARASKRLIFIEQADFPASSTNRRRLLAQIEDLAKRLPEWQIIIQPDYSQPEDAKSLDPSSFARLLLTKNLKPRPELPTNLMLGAEGTLPRILASATVSATLTSPASMAALAWGKQVMIVADYGFSSACNSQLWMGSGLVGRLAAISAEQELYELPAMHPDWFNSIGGNIKDGAQRLLASLERLLEVSPG